MGKSEETTADVPGTDPDRMVLSTGPKVLRHIVVLLQRNVSELRKSACFVISGILLCSHSEKVRVLEAREDQLLTQEAERNLVDDLSIVWRFLENFREESGLEVSKGCH